MGKYVCSGAKKTCVRTFFVHQYGTAVRHQKSKNIRLVRTLSYGSRYFRFYARLFFVMYNRMVHDYMVCSARLYGMLCTIIWYVAHENIRMHARSYTYARTYFSDGRTINRMQLLYFVH